MFGVFFYKKSKCIKLGYIRRIEKIQKKLNLNGLHLVNSKLDKIIDLLDDRLIELDDKQCDIINKFLTDIESHSNRVYESYLLTKCDYLSRCITDCCFLYDNNEDRIYELLGEMGALDAQIYSLEEEMKKVVKTDKNLWLMLNSQRKNLKIKYSILNKNYNSLLINQNNLTTFNELEKATDDCSEMVVQNENIDIYQVKENAKLIEEAFRSVEGTSAMMGEAISSFSMSLNEREYETALMESSVNLDNDISKKVVKEN